MANINFDDMTYYEIEERYKKYKIPYGYKFQNAEQVKKVLGWDFRTIRGMKNLSNEDKNRAEVLICMYLNGWGLGSRHKQRPRSIVKLENCYKVTFIDRGYSYLYFNGSVG
ncbi:hypothetical protein [Clostridium butyricum]|nr:hypothetical protein [Clostridium butyricum]AXB86048.1 hypothetical protein DRB99_14015 [Clostridium butyricum]